MSETIYELVLTESGMRLDKVLTDCIASLSRAQIQRLISDGMVTLDGKIIDRSGLKIKGGELAQVRVPPPAPTQTVPESIPLSIIYEDENLIVVDKPAGMVVHPSIGHPSGTLVNAILGYAPGIEGVGGERRPGIVHRLDKDTSGVILVVKNTRSYRFVQAQFRSRTIDKRYLALVIGSPPTPTGRIEAGIGRDPKHRQRMAVLDGERLSVRQAISEYQTIESFDKFALVEVKPVTGRTHQVRVHMAFIGCPIVGDRLYGERRGFSLGLQRHFLHACRIRVKLLDGSEKEFFSETPVELDTALRELRSV
jgi:23S rRNA pseudouridine1911/1915/1917 synthase